MVRKIVWSLQAQQDRKNILAYWKNRNKSNQYSKKLNKLFNDAVHLINAVPQVGRLTSNKTSRIKVVRDYLLVYEIAETTLHVLAIWDGRQDPAKFEERLK
jgi:addiction module RelE/StbE family toxin